MDELIPAEFRSLIDDARDLGRGELHRAEVELDRMPDPVAAYTSDVYRDAVKLMYSAGLHRQGLPPEVGGLGAPQTVRFRVLEELAYGAPGLTCKLLVTSSGIAGIVLYGLHERDASCRDHLEAYVADDQGVHTGAWAITEPAVGSDFLTFGDARIRFQARATRTANGWRLQGEKSGFISNGWLADLLLLMVNVDSDQGMEGTGTFVVPTSLPGITRSDPLDKVGLRALNQAAIAFDDVEIPEEFCVMATSPDYRQLLENIVTSGNTAVGLIALGVAQAAYDAGLAYAKQRRQGGARLIEHQLVAMKLFDAYRSIEAARLLLYRSAVRITEGEPDLKSAFAGRTLAAEACARITADMAQVHGGYGIRRDYPVEKLYRDARPLQIIDGTIERVSMVAAERL